MRRVLLLVAVLVLAGCGSTKTVTVTNTVTQVQTVTAPPPATTTTATPAAVSCVAGNLKGTFAAVQGSAGAGNISYRLTLTNTGSSACFVSGTPQVQLLGTTGGALPTSVSTVPAGAIGAKVTLHHGGSAHADARFSPDVNGTGDNAPGQCQPTATVMRVTAPGGGTLDAPIQPPTPVCERGSLQFTVYSAGS
jgi:hypothetical protein